MSRIMHWKPHYDDGVKFFHDGQLIRAIISFTKAHENSGGQVYQVLDMRAAVYEELGRTRSALQDANWIILFAPEQWTGYYRAAHALHHLSDLENASRMAQMSLDRLSNNDDDMIARATLLNLQSSLSQSRRDARRVSTDITQQLPAEILSLIFHYTNKIPACAICLSHVSGHWRAVALSTISLWSTLEIPHPLTETAVEKARAWIERSHGRIASIIFGRTLYPPFFVSGSELQPQERDMLIGLLKDIDRTSIQSITLPGTILDAAFHFAMKAAGFSDYEKCVPHFHLMDVGIFPLFVPDHAPNNKGQREIYNLHSLVSGSLNRRLDYLSTRITSLVTLDLRSEPGSHSHEDLRNLLRANLALQEVMLAFSTAQDVPNVIHNDDIITLPYLHRLELETLCDPILLLDRVRTPSLQSLVLSDITRCLAYIQELTDKPYGPAPTLKELSIISITIPVPTIISLLSLCTSLTSLRICVNRGNMDDIIRALTDTMPTTEGGVGSIPCPYLECVDFTACQNLTIDTLLDLASRRRDMESIMPLRTMVLDDCYTLKETQIPRLQAMIPFLTSIRTIVT